MAPFVAQYLYVIYGLILTVVGLCIFIDADRSDRSPRKDVVDYLVSVSIALAGYMILWMCNPQPPLSLANTILATHSVH